MVYDTSASCLGVPKHLHKWQNEPEIAVMMNTGDCGMWKLNKQFCSAWSTEATEKNCSIYPPCNYCMLRVSPPPQIPACRACAACSLSFCLITTWRPGYRNRKWTAACPPRASQTRKCMSSGCGLPAPDSVGELHRTDGLRFLTLKGLLKGGGPKQVWFSSKQLPDILKQ